MSPSVSSVSSVTSVPTVGGLTDALASFDRNSSDVSNGSGSVNSNGSYISSANSSANLANEEENGVDSLNVFSRLQTKVNTAIP